PRKYQSPRRGGRIRPPRFFEPRPRGDQERVRLGPCRPQIIGKAASAAEGLRLSRSKMTAVSGTMKSVDSSGAGQLRDITVAHSPDSDDAFMFYALATHKVRTPGLRFTHTLCDIETLNQKAREGVYDVTAISFHAYPYVQDKYALMACGGSVGEGYGPMVVSGTLTTAYLALQLFAPGIETEVVPFDQIIPQVLEGKYEAGLIIHEGQLT